MTDGSVVDLLNPRFNTTDLYLFPAVSQDNPTEVLQNTTYQIFRNGEYLGVWQANRLDPLNLSIRENLTNSTENKTITFMPRDEIEMLVTAAHPKKDHYVKPYAIQYEVPDQPQDFIVLQLDVIDMGLFRLDVDDIEGWQYLRQKNWTIDMDQYDYNSLRVKVRENSDQPIYDYISCMYDNSKIDIEMDLNTDRYVFIRGIWERPYPISHIDQFVMTIESYLFNKPELITCTLMDMTYHINEHGEIEEAVFDDNLNDLGIPNYQFNITVKPRRPQ